MSPDLEPREVRAAIVAAPRTTDAVPAPTTPAAPVDTRPAGELDTGSVTHQLPSGPFTVVVDYWTADPAASWTPASDKTIQLSARVEGADPDITILVTRFSATADDGTSRTVVAQDSGEFALAPPFSYTTALSLPPSAATADQLTVLVQFDLLVETEVESGRYFRQTVLDRLTLPLIQETTP